MLILTTISAATIICTQPAEDPQNSEPTQVETNPAQDKVDRWMKYFYINAGGEQAPEMAELFLNEAIKNLEDQSHVRTLLNVFLSEVGRTNPVLLDDWTQAAKTLDRDTKLQFIYAIWYADHKNCKQRIREITDTLPEDDARREQLSTLHEREPPNLMEMQTTDGSVLDYWWVAFMATGNTEYVARVMSALPPRDTTYDDYDASFMKIAVAGSAIWSIESFAYEHPRILKYIRDTRAEELGPWPVLDEIIEGVEDRLEESPPQAPTDPTLSNTREQKADQP